MIPEIVSIVCKCDGHNCQKTATYHHGRNVEYFSTAVSEIETDLEEIHGWVVIDGKHYCPECLQKHMAELKIGEPDMNAPEEWF